MTTRTAMSDSLRMAAMVGSDLLRSVAESRTVRDLGTRVSLRGCSCEIPPPCWLPRSLGDVKSRVCAGGRAVVRLRVTNCGASPRGVDVQARGEAAGDITITPTKLALDPMERAVVTATLPVAETASSGEEREAVLWVRGCHEHYLRWTVGAGRASDSCHEVDVDDCPDYVHHWYDHFYCEHPCVARG